MNRIPSNPRTTRNVTEQAAITAMRNILARNPRLAPDVVEKVAMQEFTAAQTAGRLFTAKEVMEIEDKVYALVNVKNSISS